jgi:hypothetical protein
MQSINDNAAIADCTDAPPLADGEVLGVDADGRFVCWNAEAGETYTVDPEVPCAA